MKRYCVNKNPQKTGEHEVHVWSCTHGPELQNKDDLGEVDSCRKAMAIAYLKGYKEVDGCKYCCEECHNK